MKTHATSPKHPGRTLSPQSVVLLGFSSGVTFSSLKTFVCSSHDGDGAMARRNTEMTWRQSFSMLDGH